MSKIGKKNITIPKESSIKVEGSSLTISGPKGTKKLTINDKIEKEWTENFVENLNFVMVSRNTIKRRYEDKGIDLIKLINDISYYNHVKKNVNSRGNLEFQFKQ